MSGATVSCRSRSSAGDLAAAAPRGRVRRAACGNVEVAGEQIRELRGRGDARRIAPAAGAAVDLLVVWALDRVGARQRAQFRRVSGARTYGVAALAARFPRQPGAR